jgi:hypothetical protein
VGVGGARRAGERREDDAIDLKLRHGHGWIRREGVWNFGLDRVVAAVCTSINRQTDTGVCSDQGVVAILGLHWEAWAHGMVSWVQGCPVGICKEQRTLILAVIATMP